MSPLSHLFGLLLITVSYLPAGRILTGDVWAFPDKKATEKKHENIKHFIGDYCFSKIEIFDHGAIVTSRIEKGKTTCH